MESRGYLCFNKTNKNVKPNQTNSKCLVDRALWDCVTSSTKLDYSEELKKLSDILFTFSGYREKTGEFSVRKSILEKVSKKNDSIRMERVVSINSVLDAIEQIHRARSVF